MFFLLSFLFHTERLLNAGTGKRLPSRSESLSESDEDNEASSPCYISSLSANRGQQARSPCAETSSSSRSTSRSLAHARVELEMKSLWDEFHALGTEMIVTKAGRLVG